MAAKKRVTKSTVAKSTKLTRAASRAGDVLSGRRATDTEPYKASQMSKDIAAGKGLELPHAPAVVAKPVDPRFAAAENKAAAFGATVRTNVAKGFGIAVGTAAFAGIVTVAVGRGLFRGIRG